MKTIILVLTMALLSSMPSQAQQFGDTYQVALAWDLPDETADLAGYLVHRGNAAGGPYSGISSATIECPVDDDTCRIYDDVFPNPRPVLQAQYDGSSVNLTWNENPDAIQYSVLRDGNTIGATGERFFSDPRPNDGTQYQYQVRANYGEYFYVVTAVDTFGNESEFSNEVSKLRLAVSPSVDVTTQRRPNPPRNLRIRIAGNNAFLNWDPDGPYNTFAFYRDGVLDHFTVFPDTRIRRSFVGQGSVAHVTAWLDSIESAPSNQVTIPSR